jgi:hypothetical protein
MAELLRHLGESQSLIIDEYDFEKPEDFIVAFQKWDNHSLNRSRIKLLPLFCLTHRNERSSGW